VLILLPRAAVAQYVQVPGVGWEGQGADVVVTNLDADPRPDMILMAYDNPDRDNGFRYKVGRNLDQNGATSDWTPGFIAVPGVGWEGQGAGAALTNLDADARPEMILVAYDNPAYGNTFRYRVGWNLGTDGVAASWSPNWTGVAGVGWEGQGADVLVTNLDDDVRPDMIFMAYDNPNQGNNFRYRVGWNLNASANAANWDANFTVVDGVGWEGQGAGASIANLDNDPRPELLLMAYDNPANGNSFRYRVGWNLGTNAQAQSWEPGFRTIAGVGWEGQGAGITMANLDGDARPEIVAMAYDAPDRDNSFRYVIQRNVGAAQRIWLEMDKLAGVAWPPASVVRNGRTNTLPDIYRRLGIEVDVRQHEGNIADPLPGTCFTDADLDAFLTAHYNNPPSPAGPWHKYAAYLTCDTGGNLGVMFDGTDRRGFAVFMNGIGAQERVLRTTAHELGHSLCLYHTDGDAWRPGGPTAGTGRTVMNQTWTLATDWDYGWSAGSWHKIYERSKRRWQPQSGFAFPSCH
jgi:hypothetical protein